MQREEVDHKTKILIVDDSRLSVDLLKQIIQPMGHEAIIAYDGITALKKVEDEKPDLILLDVMMPHVDGFQLCEKLKSDEKTRLIPIIMITALSDLADKVKGIEVGADDFINKPFNDTILFARIKSLLKTKYLNEELENAEMVITSLALSIEAKDAYAEGHCERLAIYSVALAEYLGFPEEYCRALKRGAILHDIGKIGIPDNILLKPGPLTDDEWKIMRLHPVIGEKICKPLRTLANAVQMIRHHHERWDGSGYPDGLKGEEIPITARILQVVDVYDALTTNRPYRTLLTEKDAIKELWSEAEKGWLDKELVGEFMKLLKKGIF
ncbi:MAG: response regulator [Candidatus Ancaeobacter aquaticus]|nr:response regulator [Candidatus Ancaeobacter aquaticus]